MRATLAKYKCVVKSSPARLWSVMQRLVFHWPNETPDERVKIVNVELTDDGILLLDNVGKD